MVESEQTLAEEYAAKIKAVAETRDEEIETLYREYQAKWQKQIGNRGEEIKEWQPNDSSPTPS